MVPIAHFNRPRKWRCGGSIQGILSLAEAYHPLVQAASQPHSNGLGGSRFVVLSITLLLAAWGLSLSLRQARQVASLPVLFQVPAFALVDQSGMVVGSEDLAGSTYVANLFFTSCPSVCPGHMASLATLQGQLQASGSPVAIVSISVDPATDTPERLAAYGRRFGADPSRWHLLTGEEASVRALVEGGLHSAMGSPRPLAGESHAGHDPLLPPGEPVYEISHAAHFLVVDGAGMVRALVPSVDPIPAILLALAALAAPAP